MKLVVIDVESDGPIIGENSMVCFGAVVLDKNLDKTFYGQTRPISDKYDQVTLSVSGFTRQQHEKFPTPVVTMSDFANWLKINVGTGPVLISDNNGYDASWVNYYFHKFYGSNPFGWSSRRIGDLFCGFYNDPFYKWKKHRKTEHTHNPVDDARGNAEALLYLIDQGFNLKV